MKITVSGKEASKELIENAEKFEWEEILTAQFRKIFKNPELKIVRINLPPEKEKKDAAC